MGYSLSINADYLIDINSIKQMLLYKGYKVE